MMKKGSRFLQQGCMLLICAIIAFLFMFLFAGATPNAKNAWGYDSAFFILVGQGMTKGMLPYRDFFDMKGPYLFLIEYIGQKLAYGRIGAFIMEVVALTWSLFAADRIYQTVLQKKKTSSLFSVLLMVPVLATICITFSGGNYTEEYCLPFLMFSVYFALRFFRSVQDSESPAHPLTYGAFYGFSFGVIALIRITNAAQIGAILLTISVYLLLKKQVKNWLLNGVAFLAGTAIAVVPMCIYYGAHGLLGEMLSQVFLFGVQYSAEVSLTAKALQMLTGIYAPCILIPWLPVIVQIICREKRPTYWLLTITSAILVCAAVVMGNGYLHYFTLAAPCVTLALYLWVEYNDGTLLGKLPRGARVCVIAALCIVIAGIAVLTPRVPILQKAFGNFTVISGDRSDTQLTQIKEMIPQEEQNSVYTIALESCSGWYAEADILPPNRYCDWQAHYIELKPQIGTELETWLRTDGAKWIVGSVQFSIEPKAIRDAIQENYSIVYQNEKYVLYHRNPM